MDNIVNAEISPGTIQATTCHECGQDALKFDVLALADTGVGYVGTIVKCGHCEGAR